MTTARSWLLAIVLFCVGFAVHSPARAAREFIRQIRRPAPATGSSAFDQVSHALQLQKEVPKGGVYRRSAVWARKEGQDCSGDLQVLTGGGVLEYRHVDRARPLPAGHSGVPQKGGRRFCLRNAGPDDTGDTRSEQGLGTTEDLNVEYSFSWVISRIGSERSADPIQDVAQQELPGGLEELDRIAVRIFDPDLLASGTYPSDYGSAVRLS